MRIPRHSSPLLLVWFVLAPLVWSLNTDGVALLALSKSLLLPDSVLSTWNSSHSSPCRWTGVRCGAAGRRVVSLDLSDRGVSGALGPEIGRLSRLRQLILSGNSLSGQIPPELGNCSLLENIDLSSSGISGEIPGGLWNLRRLSHLSLYQNSLSGEIPNWLFHLPALDTVYLNRNNFSGAIPESVGNMTGGTVLWLNRNSLSGQIPSSLGNCSKLQEIYLQDNQFTGAIPDSFANLRKLVYLYLSRNKLAGRIPLGSAPFPNLKELELSSNSFTGEIPGGIGNWTRLVIFSVTRNNLSGPIPPSFGSLTALSDLLLPENRLSGPIPPRSEELANLSSLKSLILFGNNLSGELPRAIWSIPTLQEVLIYDNNLSGELPPEMAELRDLKNVTLFNNRFSGQIPPGLGLNSSLEIVDFTNNSFVGEIPPHICSGKQLWALDLGSNLLHGSIPPGVGSCSTLRRLILQNNNLTGPIPDFASNSSLAFLDLSGNHLSGPIPKSLGSCKNISSIILSLNKLTGTLPPEIGNLKRLTVLKLSSNSLSGEIPGEISSCSQINQLDVGFNSLNGSLPESMANLTRLTRFRGLFELQLGGNDFGGRIPSSLGSLENLNAGLNLSGNGLVGDLSSLASLKTLLRLDLSKNNLTGDLSHLEDIPLTFLNVSHNHLSGPVPKKFWALVIASPSSFLGNPELCIPCQSGDSICSDRSVVLSPCTSGSASGRGLRRIHVIAIALCSSIACLVVVLLSVHALLRRKKPDRGTEPALGEGSSLLLRKVMEATENLNDRHVLGRGAHGTVYRAQLSQGKFTRMMREIETMGKIRHRSLVKLVDFWMTDEYGLILYDYMQNGSLHDVLHLGKPPLALGWNLRHRIALGTAHGLAYLHHDCNPCIIHRDIKPKNILLDSEMEAHISDFGIAGLLDQCSSPGDTSGLMGTFGYISPESGFSTRRSRESDVYSYGVVLLELITRKMSLDPSFPEDTDLVRWVTSTLDGSHELERIVDPDLAQEVSASGEAEEVREALLLALRCIDRDPNRRPSMREVVKLLQDMKSSVSRSRPAEPTTFGRASEA
ncbi:unnamed protein product [Spirodela intermedia]|uniref:non-specific serine/threonine protein kinase n=1 Tax=Spirodela intermedia TaxID=51605 RepID=A0A7I8IX85_SPIIN|nr:unnamed protein product [Spirodela intermedia]CAA6662294.1 unnamed protein product [Spirodela intermedia]